MRPPISEVSSLIGDLSSHRSEPFQAAVQSPCAMEPEDSDATLAARFRDGDRHAGAALFDRHFAALARFFANKVVQESDQDDLVQATFTACLGAVDRYRGEGPFRSFLFGIAYNVLRRHFERGRANPIDLGYVSAVDLAPGPSTIAGARGEQQGLADALRTLPVEQQTIIELFYWESMTAAEIGRSLGVPEGTVRTRLRRSRALLLEALAEAEPKGDDELGRRLRALQS